MSVLTDPLSGIPYSYGAILPSAHVSTVWNQQPRAVDGGTPVGSTYPGDISFSGTHTHEGPGTIDAAATSMTIGSITADSLTFASNEEAPFIRHAQVPGIDGNDGSALPITVQQGQAGGLSPGGAGGDLVLGLGLPGSGSVDGDLGRLVKQWGDSAGYKWRDYSWCSGEVAYSTTPSYPLTVDVADGEIHSCEVYLIARDVVGGTTTKTSLRSASIQNNSGTVTISGQGQVWSYGGADVAALFEVGAGATWRLNLGSSTSAGDAVIFLKWRVASLDGS